MSKMQEYSRIQPHLLPLSIENWQTVLKKPIKNRQQFKHEGQTLHTGQVVGRFLGIPTDEDGYFNDLYDYAHDSAFKLHLISEDKIDKTIDNTQFQAIQKVLQIHKDNKLSVNRFVAFLDGERLLPQHSNAALHRQYRQAFIEILKHYEKQYPEGLRDSSFRRVLVDIIKWSWNHLHLWLKNTNPELEMPRVFWYGDANTSQRYFLYYLFAVGCDLVIFHPASIDVLELIDSAKEKTFVYQYPQNGELKPFPKEKSKRKTTVAYRASKEIEMILNHDGSGLYKPWQLREYTPSSITLKTTYDELFLLIREKASIRPNFDVNNGEVKIPSLFAKVQGVSRNRKEYWNRLQAISESEFTLLVREFPFTKNIQSDYRFHYRDALGKNGKLVPEKIIQSHYWKYHHLPVGLQKGVAAAISRMCTKTRLKQQNGETIQDVQLYMFKQAVAIPEAIMQLLQKFDYSQEVPRLILYNNEMNGTLSRSDAAMLLLLNQFGVDIVIYNPPGHNDIEMYVDETIFDTHWLDDVVFEQEFKETSFIKKIITNSFLKNIRGD